MNKRAAKGFRDWQYAARQMTFITAGGTISAIMYLRLKVPAFHQKTEAIILDDSPALLSVGRRVRDAGMSFIWLAEAMPCMVTRNSVIVCLDIDGGLPTLREGCLCSDKYPTFVRNRTGV